MVIWLANGGGIINTARRSHTHTDPTTDNSKLGTMETSNHGSFLTPNLATKPTRNLVIPTHNPNEKEDKQEAEEDEEEVMLLDEDGDVMMSAETTKKNKHNVKLKKT